MLKLQTVGKKAIQRKTSHKLHLQKNKKPSPHDRYWAEILGIISNSLNLIFEVFPIERTKGGWRKGHLAQISFKEELQFLLVENKSKKFSSKNKKCKKETKGSSCNIRKKPKNKWERELSAKNTNSSEERDTKEANAQM